MTTSEKINTNNDIPREKIDLIEPTTGKLFFEHKSEFIFCKPHLMPLKSQALERLEEMQRETARKLLQKRMKKQESKETETTATSATPKPNIAPLFN